MKLKESCTFVIFGATGNLARTKLLPALYNLDAAGKLTDNMRIIGTGRRDWDAETYRSDTREALEGKKDGELEAALVERFLSRLDYVRVDLSTDNQFEDLKQRIESDPSLPPNIIFYLSISPQFYARTANNLAACRLNEENGGWRRLVVEKPFGYDLESAQALDLSLHKNFRENQIFRIDHYLGKETVQNIFVFRFANLMLEPLWNRHYVDHVQIIHSEKRGIGHRAGYFDKTGALRDMVQSHLLQVLTMVAMESPPNLEPESIRDEKVKVLKSIRPIPRNAVNANVFRAQYTGGSVDGESAPAYADEDNIETGSATETFAAMRLYIDNWRWKGVPFYLRTGKRLAENSSLVSITFKTPPQQLFRETPIDHIEPNGLVLSIQPLECIRLELQVRENGLEMKTRCTHLDANSCELMANGIGAYDSLLLDIMQGDRSLFLRSDEVKLAWRIVDPILDTWSTERDYISTYPAGSWGPEEADRLFHRSGINWRNTL